MLAVPSSFYLYNRSESYMPTRTNFTRNPRLSAISGMEDYPGTPLDQKGLFMNEEFVFWPKLGDLIKWQTTRNPWKEEKKNDTRRLEVTRHASLTEIPGNSLLWLGHATFLITLANKRILIDPVLDSPSPLMKRYSELSLATGQLTGLDYILISHDHRDHCDEDSIRLLARQNPEAVWLCGLSLDKLLEKWTGSRRIQAAGWYQQYNTPGVQVSYLPTRHWSRRGLTDTNATLWGAFMIQAAGKKIYFGGDSGYGSHLKKVRELYGEVDYYLAGIGAFAPRWFMGPSHMHPEEAARASNDLQPKNLLPMHFGTFDLSDEPLLEPARLIGQLKENNAFGSRLVLPEVGEIVRL